MRKQILTAILMTFFAASFLTAQTQKQIIIETKNTVLVFTVDNDKRLYQSYLGEKLDGAAEYSALKTGDEEAYPTYGNEYLFEPAMKITHADGNQSLELEFVNSTSEKTSDDITATKILLKDPQYPVEVTLNFKTYYNEDVIEQWVSVKHNEKGDITLYNYASSALSFDAHDYWLTQFHGDWAEEMHIQESKLTSGIKTIDSKLGTRAHMYQTPVFFVSFDKQSDENSGELIAGTLAWSGSFQFQFEVDPENTLHVLAGINPFASDYKLAAGKEFTTPEFIFTYSKNGKGEASRKIHKWARNYGLLDGNKPRLTLLNNWESTRFDFDENKLTAVFQDAKKLGVDLFLLDDGWFANKYPRNDDKAGLGDWQVNKKKLPHGIGYLVKEGEQNSVKFGIWIEPEMVNPKSELYENHPEWVLKFPNREERYFRNQLVLDLTNPAVQDFVYGIVDTLLTENPGVAFIKWDCNSMIVNPYSPYLKNEQSHLYIDYVEGLYKVLDRMRAKYPHLPIMLCSGGGGRVDYGALKYFTEFWPSDNTDGYDRVFIQWGYSYFYPAISMCAHVTSWGKQTLKYRTDVAMMGKLGYDIPVEEMTADELKFSQEAVKNYKRLSDVIWYGDLYRLISPYEENRAVLMYVNEARDKSVLFAYNLETRRESFEPVKLLGLDPEKKYKIEEINLFPGIRTVCPESGKIFTGDQLMKAGLTVSSDKPLTSAVIEITEVK